MFESVTPNVQITHIILFQHHFLGKVIIWDLTAHYKKTCGFKSLIFCMHACKNSTDMQYRRLRMRSNF